MNLRLARPLGFCRLILVLALFSIMPLCSAPNAMAVGSFDNAVIADYATSHYSVGSYGGQCRTFVNNVVSSATGLNVGTGWPDYFAGFENAGAQRITSIDDLRKGDIVQYGQSESDPSLHTFIIISRVSGSTFHVIDSNHLNNERVDVYDRTNVTLNNAKRAYRLGTVNTAATAGPSGANYQPFAADFNDDGYADIGMRDSSNGWFFIRHGNGFSDQVGYQWAAGSNYQPYAADFNDDGIGDIGMRDSSNGIFFIKHGPDFTDQTMYQWASGTNYQPFVADFNHDGYADIGMRDSSNGWFFIKHGPSFSDQVSFQWAAGSNYQPYAADFNDDGIGDIGMRDSSNGWFFIRHGPSFGDQVSYLWAAGTNYQPFAGDFNGDGLADIGMRDSSNGIFFIKHGDGFNDQISYPWAAG